MSPIFLQFVNQKDDFILDSLSSKQRYDFDMKRSIAMAKLSRESGDLETTKAMLGGGIGSALMPDGNALGLHFVMFVPTIMGQVGWPSNGTPNIIYLCPF